MISTALQPEAALIVPHATVAFTLRGLVLLTGDPQTFTAFSLISIVKVRKVKSAILGLPLSFLLPYRDGV